MRQKKKRDQVVADMRRQLTGILGEREAHSTARFAAEFALGKHWSIEANREVQPAEYELITTISDRLMNGEPLQYVLGHTEFYGLQIGVDPTVLIPRPETEELVDWFVQTMRPTSTRLNILDAATGSGCIALAVANALPGSNVMGCDVSEQALETARRNAEKSGLDVAFFQVDLLSAGSLAALPPFDILISNPPYVETGERDRIPSAVLDHEPHLALFAPEGDSMAFYRALAHQAGKVLNHHSAEWPLWFELHEQKSEDVKELLTHAGYSRIEIKKDMQDKVRMLRAGF